MVTLPAGTVTFLLTDVAGSTALWEQADGPMRAALARHDVLFEAAVFQHGGVSVKPRGEGDSRFAVFASAPDAAAAALAVQRVFAAELWPTPAPIRVRIGVHTGEAQLRDGDYYGTAVNRCARLRGIGHGGQTLLSEATAALVRDHLPPDVQLIDLGHHRLKDLTRPEHVFQLSSDELPALFPPLASLDARPHNLPLQSTALLGRTAELDAVRTMLLRDDVRLVTLTGPGGTGKTRLALQAAADLLDRFADGVIFVDLAPITDPARLPAAIAAPLGMTERSAHLLDDLKAHLAPRSMLLLLDNFEQVLAGAPIVAELLAASPALSILVTSRAPLQLRAEHEIAVPPLSIPSVGHRLSPDDLAQYSAVALFVERAQAVQPAFSLTPENAQAITTVCARLDGLPLALELAAARVRVLTPEALAARLERRLPLLTGGPRDLPARQRTLRDTIAWSYDLLEEPEQRVFRALSVFVGGFTLDAAEAVVGGTAADGSGPAAAPIDVLDAVSQLVARNLVRQTGETEGEPRFGLLETIREFGLEQLEAAGELVAVRDRHLAWALRLAEGSASREPGAAVVVALNRAEAELDNMRAALAWGIQSCQAVDAGRRLALALSTRIWTLRGHLREGSTWLQRLVTVAAPGSQMRGLLLARCGYLALRQNDYVTACAAFAEALEIWNALGDQGQVVATLQHFGIAQYHGGDHVRGRATLEEGLRLARIEGDRQAERVCLRNLADIYIDVGEYPLAHMRYEESLAIARAANDEHDTAYALRGLGHIARVQGQYTRAAACLRESVVLLRPLRDRRCLPLSLEGLACITVGSGWAERAARIFGAVHAMQEQSGAPSPPAAMADYERTLADARSALGTERFLAAWAEGAAMSLDDVVELALAAPSPADEPVVAPSREGREPVPRRTDVPLSAREIDVVRLIAQGRSNRQIAEQLVLSVRTVERHIENVYNRLGISGKAGRAIVTAYVLRHHLLDDAAAG